MPGVRKIRDADDAEACLGAAGKAGLAPRDWAHQHGVDARSLQMWRVLLARRRPAQPAPLRLVELVSAVAPVAEPARYRLTCNEFTLELVGAFDDRDVLRLLRLVRAC